MNIYQKNRVWLAAAVALFVCISCSSSENTIVIEDAPVATGRTDTVTQKSTDTAFRQLTIGELTPIRSLDPLFAENTGDMHAIQLLFEGLVQYDESGETTPAIAKRWSVGEDGRTYRFTLKDRVFYHDKDVFSNGLGRKLTAGDVKYVFERMAKEGVPDHAARLFMNIRGFEPYFQEQHQILIAADRQLKTVSGIRAPNDSTVVFSLVEPDPDFIDKLATPYAVIYPKEALSGNGFKAVGSGPFKLSQKRTDGWYIFSKFENYRVQGQPKLNRVDIRTEKDEKALLDAFTKDDIQLIPRLGPWQMRAVSMPDGSLKSNLKGNYKLIKSGAEDLYFLQYNANAYISKDKVAGALKRVNSASLFTDQPGDNKMIQWTLPNSSSSALPDSIYSNRADDPFIQFFYSALAGQLQKNNVSFSARPTPVISRNVELFTTRHTPFYGGQPVHQPDDTFAVYTMDVWKLADKNVDSLYFNDFSWWIDLRTATLPTATR